MKTELINDGALESNKEVTETLNHVRGLTSLTHCVNDEMCRLAVSSQCVSLFSPGGSDGDNRNDAAPLSENGQFSSAQTAAR